MSWFVYTKLAHDIMAISHKDELIKWKMWMIAE